VGVNFDALVLSPCEDIFAIACRFTLASDPANPVIGRGVYSSAPLNVVMENETIFSDQQTSLGIRLRDFVIAPDRGDVVEIIDANHPAYGKTYWIGDSDLDGQGGVTLLLRTQEPPA
jgi:hypothetical protein